MSEMKKNRFLFQTYKEYEECKEYKWFILSLSFSVKEQGEW